MSCHVFSRTVYVIYIDLLISFFNTHMEWPTQFVMNFYRADHHESTKPTLGVSALPRKNHTFYYNISIIIGIGDAICMGIYIKVSVLVSFELYLYAWSGYTLYSVHCRLELRSGDEWYNQGFLSGLYEYE